MPIGLPPVLPPQLAEVQEIRSAAPSIAAVEFRGYRIHVLAPESLGDLPVARLLAGAHSLSEAVYRLGVAAAAAGFPAAQARYGVAGQDIFVFLQPGHVSRVEGPAGVAAFFEDTVGAEPLEISTFERDRALAGPHADRLALAIRPSFRVDESGDPAGRVLQLEAAPADEIDILQADFGNPGNRYVGEYHAGLGATLVSPWGDEFNAGVRRGASRFNDDDGDYSEQSLRWRRALPHGEYGLSAQRVFFIQRGASQSDHLVWDYGLTWSLPIYADLLRRYQLQVGLDHVARRGDDALSDTLLLDESYDSLELSGAWSRASYPGPGMRVLVESGIALRKGFGERDPARSPADLGYILVRPVLGVTLKSAGDWQFLGQLQGQASRDAVPEQQQFVLGGLQSVTAFQPGIGLGDSGYAARLEMRREWRVGTVNLTPRVFAENGRARLGAVAAERADQEVTVTDAGCGLVLQWNHIASAGLAYAEPLSVHGASASLQRDMRVRLLFTVQIRLI